MSEERRIYVIVAETVQTPTVTPAANDGPERLLLCPTAATKNIVQPRGRIAAQVAHVVSKMRLAAQDSVGFMPYTTIILSVPDSYQLQFRAFLLETTARTRAYRFYDTNEEYGQDEVLTAICTEPVFRKQLGFAFDYLNLWS
jgi:hypothetical protein